MDKFLIAGLGNVGPEYAGTRHNIGFDVVDLFVEKHAGSFNMQRLAAVAEVKLKGKKLICIKPSTFMNLSGKAVKYWLENENVSVENLLVIADDLAIPLDKLRLRPAGSSGGITDLQASRNRFKQLITPNSGSELGMIIQRAGRWNMCWESGPSLRSRL